MNKIHLALILLILSIGTSHANVTTSINGKFDAGGLKLHLQCYGSNSPSIIVQSAFNGYGSEGHWDTVIKAISAKNRICLYDRANMGKSDPILSGYNINDESRQLHQLLNNVGVKPPYVMVGHSYGSYPVRAFNHLYPQEVSAILLIDPSQYGKWFNRIAKWRPVTEKYNPSQEAQRLEDLAYWNDPSKNPAHYNLKQNAKIIKQANDFGDKPFVLLWAKDGIWQPTNGHGDNHKMTWQRMKNLYLQAIKDMNKLSTNMKIEYAKTGKHHIHFYEPQTVIKQLNYLLEAL